MMGTCNRRDWLASAGLVSANWLLPNAWAQSAWPNKPLRLVVPFAPGG